MLKLTFNVLPKIQEKLLEMLKNPEENQDAFMSSEEKDEFDDDDFGFDDENLGGAEEIETWEE